MSPLDNVKILRFPKISDSRGDLTFVEESDGLPFPVKRVFYIYDIPEGAVRGGHAHKTNCELLFCLSGSMDLHLTDGRRQLRYHVDDPANGIIIPPDVWTDMHNFKPGTLLLVLCSEPYQKVGYIHDYDEYRRYIDAQLS